MDDHGNTGKAAQGSSSKRWLLFAVIAMVLVALSAGVILTKPGYSPFGFAPEVELVRDGRLDKAPWATVGEAFDQFLSDSKWEVIHAEDGGMYVNLIGRLVYMKKPVEGKLQFSVDMEARRWELVAVEFNGIPQNNMIKGGLFMKAFEDVSTPFATAYREARQNIANIRTAQEAYYSAFDQHVSAPPHPSQANESGTAWGKHAEGFDELGFVPNAGADGTIHCTYAVSTSGTAYTIGASCYGGPEGPIYWGYQSPDDQTGEVLTGGPFGKCGPDGVWSANGEPLGIRKVGLCSKPS